MVGTLKGYDQLMNLVMDDVEETLRDEATGRTTGATRSLGLTVLRGPAITLLSPADGMEEIAKYVYRLQSLCARVATKDQCILCVFSRSHSSRCKCQSSLRRTPDRCSLATHSLSR